MRLSLQVAAVSKPLLAVRRIVEKDKHVVFGPSEQDKFISNKRAGDKMILKPNGRGSYLMKVNFVGGGSTDITVDSGAEESVCPWEWGQQFGCRAVGEPLKFRNASGKKIHHLGSRDVEVVFTF
eukprot:12428763-Karenia_brevis.AAC.1